MLHDQSLPFFLWVEACRTVVYLQNRSPHRVVGNKTPKESLMNMIVIDDNINEKD